MTASGVRLVCVRSSASSSPSSVLGLRYSACSATIGASAGRGGAPQCRGGPSVDRRVEEQAGAVEPGHHADQVMESSALHAQELSWSWTAALGACTAVQHKPHKQHKPAEPVTIGADAACRRSTGSRHACMCPHVRVTRRSSNGTSSGSA